MTALVHYLQIIAGLAWLIPAVMFLPGAGRVLIGHATSVDALRFPIWLFAADQVGFVMRWVEWPQAMPAMNATELTAWAACYFISILAAVGLIVARHFAERLR